MKHAALFCLLLLLPTLVYAQSDAIPYLWQEGDLALAYPAGWNEPISTTVESGALLTILHSTASAQTTRLAIERLPPTSGRPLDLLNTRLNAVEIIVSQPLQTTLIGLTAFELSGQNVGNTIAGIGRAAMLNNGDTLLVWGTAVIADSSALLEGFATLTASLVIGATQMPLIPDGSGASFSQIGHILTFEQPSFGAFADIDTPQRWSFEGLAGEIVSIFATDINRTERLNVRVRLYLPDGNLYAENDNHNGASFYGLFSLYDAGLYGVPLPMEGVYTVMVERIFGEGVYSVGVSKAEAITLSEETATRVYGIIDDVFAAHFWTFPATTGQVFTFTMTAVEGASLDAALRLYAPDGRIIAQNDDAADPSLGLNAQLVRVVIPEEGVYRLEATRYAGEGSGAYEVIIATSG
jgi:hypothetical protein